MSNLRRMMMAQGGDNLVPFCDIEGRQIFTTLSDGLHLKFMNYFNGYGISLCSVYEEANSLYLTPNGEKTDSFIQIKNTDLLTKNIICLAKISVQEDVLYNSEVGIRSYNQNGNVIDDRLVVGEKIKKCCLLTTVPTGKTYICRIRNVYYGKMCVISDHNLFNLDEMFESCQYMMPTNKQDFQSMFVSNGHDALGRIATTTNAVDVVVKKGKLWYAS